MVMSAEQETGEMRIRKLTSTGLLTLGVLAGGLALGGAPALAAVVGHGPVTGSFGSATSTPADPFPLSDPTGVAVDELTHDVYVVDTGNNRVEEFNSSGQFLKMFGGNVDGAGVNTCTSGCLAGTAGSGDGQFNGPTWIAVNNTGTSPGDVYVADVGNRRVEKFTSEGVYVSQIGRGGVEGGVAVTPSGYLWVDEGSQSFSEFNPSDSIAGSYSSDCSQSPGFAVDAKSLYFYCAQGGIVASASGIIIHRSGATGLATDPAHSELYVDWGTSVGEYDISGESLVQFGSGSLIAGSGIAEDAVDGSLYVADSSSGLVDVFGSFATPSEPKTEGGKVEGPSSVTLNGELRGGETGYHFVYNDNGSCKGGGSTGAGTAAGTVKESATLSGLEPNTEYSYCIVATDEFGPEFGSPMAIRTEGEPVTVEAVGSSGVGPSEATLEATVNPEKQVTTCAFEYAKSSEPYGGPRVPCEPAVLDLNEGPGSQSASLHLEGLQPNTTYKYRVFASNETPPAAEGAGEFTTPPEPALRPTIEAESVSVESESGVGQRSVLVNAQVNPNFERTTRCVIEYGETEAYGKEVPCEPSEHFEGGTGVGFATAIHGLAAGVDYHCRVVVANETGASEGGDEVFGPPAVVTGAVLSEVPGVASSTTATVGGKLNPEGLDTHYVVEYGIGAGAEYEQSSPAFLPGIDGGSGKATLTLGGEGEPSGVALESLTAGAVYHYRLVAYNEDGTTYGAPETVTVLPVPSVGPATVSEVTQSTATITTSVNPEGLHTLYKLDVGTSTAYGTYYPGDAGSGSATVALTFKLNELLPGDSYHFRLIASNSNGTTSEPDQTFTTAPSTLSVLPAFAVPASPLLVAIAAPGAFPTEAGAITTGTGTTKTKPLTKAQKLAKALKACARKPKGKRAACERQAHRTYGEAKRKGK
jgi:hypothetical protein